MNIWTVTFTGADESVEPGDVFQVNKDFQGLNVEWGLLLSKSNQGKQRRYPSMKWIEDFCKAAPADVALAGHIQGRWLRDLAEDKFSLPSELPLIWERLNRVQLNFHSVPTHVALNALVANAFHCKQVILQMDGVNDALFVRAFAAGLDFVPLFDRSAGQGLVPGQWPMPMPGGNNGYAGGLGPENIAEELKRIEAVAGDHKIWIDMETRIRSEDDKFDLASCRQVLDVVRHFNR